MPTVCPNCDKEFKCNVTSGKCDGCGYVMVDLVLKQEAIEVYKQLSNISGTCKIVAPSIIRHLERLFPRINFFEECDDNSSSDECDVKRNY